MIERVAVIERAVTALITGDLDAGLLGEARSAAHTLAGSAGTFGYVHASQLAREIESELEDAGVASVPGISKLTLSLRGELEAEAAATLSAPPVPVDSDEDRVRVPLQATRALLVDDDPAALDAMRVLLEGHQFEVFTLADPGRFWETLQEVEPELLLLDLDMPGVNGRELCGVVRGDARWSHLAVIFVTAHSDPETVQSLFAAGADDYIAKPLKGSELLVRVSNRLERIRLHRQHAESDGLTGLATRAKASETLGRLLLLGERFSQPVAVAMLDLDRFKAINDTQGHAAGDSVLRGLGRHLAREFRGNDVVGRWGGEEFAAGMLCSIIADVIYGYGVLHDTYTNGDPIDTLYMLEFALFALAGSSQQPVQPGDISLDVSQWRQASTRASWLPYLAAPIGFVLLLGVDWTHPFFPELSLVVIALLIGTLIAARQYLALRELARAEGALRESELRFRAIFDNAGVGIAFSNIEGPAIIDINQTFSQMVGYTPAELRGQDFNAITHPEDIALFQALTPDTLQGFQRELRVLHRDGHELWGNLTLSLLRDTEGTPRFIIGALQDITQRKEAEKIKDEFLSVVGHELRTPLTSIRGSLGLLEGGVLGELPEEATSILSIAVTNTDRLVPLINDILDVERLSSGHVEIELTPIKATDLLHQATQTVQGTATLNQLELHSEATDLLVSVDNDRVIQVLVNLLGNAIKAATPPRACHLSDRQDRRRRP